MASLSSELADAVRTEIASSATNPLPNSVIHATADLDICIQSIEQKSTRNAGPSQSLTPLLNSTTGNSADEDVDFQNKALAMQAWWGEAIAKNMDLPEGYARVAVLLIRWADELDKELNTGEETRELEALFRDRFHYDTKTVELNVRRKAQHQLDAHVSEFIRDNDGPHNLLIVYYTGHGRYPEAEKYLELTATRSPLPGKFTMDARANWNKVENLLQHEDVEADVLTILDTCYSSNHVKSSKQYNKKCELLSACMLDQTTSSPGDYSFTRALIDAIVGKEGLLGTGERPFSTFSLSQRINLNKRRHRQPCGIWDRGKTVQHSDPHIYLVPLKPGIVRDLQQATWRPLPKAYLTLRFGLRDKTMNEEQIEFITMTLAKKFNSKAMVGLRRIDWVGIEPAPPITHFQRVALVMSVIKKWRRFLKRPKEEKEQKRLSQSTVDKISMAACTKESDGEDLGAPLRSPLKRAMEKDMSAESPMDSKRRHLDIAEPPSPPVSTSSLVDHDLL